MLEVRAWEEAAAHFERLEPRARALKVGIEHHELLHVLERHEVVALLLVRISASESRKDVLRVVVQDVRAVHHDGAKLAAALVRARAVEEAVERDVVVVRLGRRDAFAVELDRLFVRPELERLVPALFEPAREVEARALGLLLLELFDKRERAESV